MAAKTKALRRDDPGALIVLGNSATGGGSGKKDCLGCLSLLSAVTHVSSWWALQEDKSESIEDRSSISFRSVAFERSPGDQEACATAQAAPGQCKTPSPRTTFLSVSPTTRRSKSNEWRCKYS